MKHVYLQLARYILSKNQNPSYKGHLYIVVILSISPGFHYRQVWRQSVKPVVTVTFIYWSPAHNGNFRALPVHFTIYFNSI